MNILYDCFAAICCCTGKFVCKIYSTPNDLNYGKAILKGSMSETTYCCSSRVKPYHTNKLKLKTSKKIPAFLVQIETPDFEATVILESLTQIVYSCCNCNILIADN